MLVSVVLTFSIIFLTGFAFRQDSYSVSIGLFVESTVKRGFQSHNLNFFCPDLSIFAFSRFWTTVANRKNNFTTSTDVKMDSRIYETEITKKNSFKTYIISGNRRAIFFFIFSSRTTRPCGLENSTRLPGLVG